MADSWFRLDGENIILTVHVRPGAKCSGIDGLHGKALKIRLAAPPVDGRANETLLRLIAELFEVPLRMVTLQRGEKSRQKVVRVHGSSVAPESIIGG